MKTMDATMLAVITNRCIDMMQDAAVAYYAHQTDAREHHTKKAIDALREMAERLGFTVEEKSLEAAE